MTHSAANAGPSGVVKLPPGNTVEGVRRLEPEVVAAGIDHEMPAVAVRERRAILALGPSDPLGARVELAQALLEAGDRGAARREVLGVLEQAPTYERAQHLLLALRNAPPGGAP